MRPYRKYVVDRVVHESESIKSVYLRPADGEPLRHFLPGQHLPIKVTIDDVPIYRCYTLSDSFKESHYRLTIKREAAQGNNVPRGRVSNYLHDELLVDDIIEAQAPTGAFFLDLNNEQPVALIGGGIGITPMISMVNASIEAFTHREIYVVHAVRNSALHAFKEDLRRAAREHENVHLFVLYSQPRLDDVSGRDFDQIGRLDLSVLRRVLPHLDMQFFICGPDSMMAQLSGELIAAGLSAAQIHMEHFHVSKPPPTARKAASGDATARERDILVEFRQSGKVLPWDAEAKSLLTFALANDVYISSGCEYGDCGTCLTPLLSGAVAYGHRTGIDPDPGSCLPCSCKPVTSIVLDA